MISVLLHLNVVYYLASIDHINVIQEEDLYKAFATDNPELDVEAIRVPRDPQTSISKGFAFVLFKTKVGPFFMPCLCLRDFTVNLELHAPLRNHPYSNLANNHIVIISCAYTILMFCATKHV